MILYRILKEDSFLTYKRSLDIEVQPANTGLPTKLQLTELAKQLYSQYEGEKYDRVFICYYLPGMVLNSGAWATSHFNPDLEVRILGRHNG